MSLVENVKTLIGRELNEEEIRSLSKFQQLNGIDDSDPLIVVLALLAKGQLVMETLPDLLLSRANDTIELHRQTLREQSTLIAKELITELVKGIAKDIKVANVDWKIRLISYGACFISGAIVGAIALHMWGH